MAQPSDEHLRALRFLARHRGGCAEEVLLAQGFNAGRACQTTRSRWPPEVPSEDHRGRAEGGRGVIAPLRLQDSLDAEHRQRAVSRQEHPPGGCRSCAPHSGALLCRDSPHSGAASDDNVANHAMGAVNRSFAAQLRGCSAMCWRSHFASALDATGSALGTGDASICSDIGGNLVITGAGGFGNAPRRLKLVPAAAASTIRRCSTSCRLTCRLTEQVAGNVDYCKTPPFFGVCLDISLHKNLDGLAASVNFDPYRRVAKIHFVSAAIVSSDDRMRHFLPTSDPASLIF
jgi:hypothetical protein